MKMKSLEHVCMRACMHMSVHVHTCACVHNCSHLLVTMTDYRIKIGERGWEEKAELSQALLCASNRHNNTLQTYVLNLFIYLFMAVLGLRFCARAFPNCSERGPLFIAVRGPLTVAASPVAEHRLQTRRLSSCGSRALLLRGMWDLPRPGFEPVSPALAGRFLTTVPPGKPQTYVFITEKCVQNSFSSR